MMNQSCLNEVRQMERIFAMLEQFSFCTFRNQSWKRNWKKQKTPIAQWKSVMVENTTMPPNNAQ